MLETSIDQPGLGAMLAGTELLPSPCGESQRYSCVLCSRLSTVATFLLGVMVTSLSTRGYTAIVTGYE